ncbi:MAG: HTH domain-containing protein [Planctomycetes bacterium]|nr:HTH domain-containing protein [Planctomycetota bacterium]
MPANQKRHFRCVECSTKTSTTDPARAAVRVCVRCRPVIEATQARAKARSKPAAAPRNRPEATSAAPAIERIPGTLNRARELIGSPNGDFEGFRRKGFTVGYLYEEPADPPAKSINIVFAKRRLTFQQIHKKFAAIHRQGKMIGARVSEVMLDPSAPENAEADSDAAPVVPAPSIDPIPTLPAEAAVVSSAAKPASDEAKIAVPSKRRKPSALDAAAAVLRDTGEAMTPKEIFEAIVTRSLWASPKGKTPQFTIAAALGREIATGGDDCRFMKAGRGKFAALAAGKTVSPREMVSHVPAV